MEKIFMVIIVCFNTICQGMWQSTTYENMNDCMAASPAVKEYFMSTLPNSNGEIYCLEKEEFEQSSDSDCSSKEYSSSDDGSSEDKVVIKKKNKKLVFCKSVIFDSECDSESD